LTTSLPGRKEFAHTRNSLLVAVNARAATSPTALVKKAGIKAAIEEAAAEEAAIEESGEQAAALGDATVGETGPQKYPRRGSNKSAAIGTAVHRVLELVNLANPSDDEIMRLAELACAESAIPALVRNVAGRVGTALHADVVKQAGQSGRDWREVYLIVRAGDGYVEGVSTSWPNPPTGSWWWPTTRRTKSARPVTSQPRWLTTPFS
jgi:ATP-dependent helicase/nuclease subunit A